MRKPLHEIPSTKTSSKSENVPNGWKLLKLPQFFDLIYSMIFDFAKGDELDKFIFKIQAHNLVTNYLTGIKLSLLCLAIINVSLFVVYYFSGELQTSSGREFINQ
jgi:hypothetical protein